MFVGESGASSLLVFFVQFFIQNLQMILNVPKNHGGKKTQTEKCVMTRADSRAYMNCK